MSYEDEKELDAFTLTAISNASMNRDTLYDISQALIAAGVTTAFTATTFEDKIKSSKYANTAGVLDTMEKQGITADDIATYHADIIKAAERFNMEPKHITQNHVEEHFKREEEEMEAIRNLVFAPVIGGMMLMASGQDEPQYEEGSFLNITGFNAILPSSLPNNLFGIGNNGIVV